MRLGFVTVPAGLALTALLTIRDETDEGGRLLLEDSAPKEARRRAQRAGIAMDAVTCPYKETPSRLGGLMNESAYDALRHDTAAVLDGLAWLTTHYLELFPTRRSTVRAMFDVSHLGNSLPLLLFHRGADPVPRHGRLPTFVASIFKASRGMSSAAVDLLNKRGPQFRKVAPDEVVRFADEEGHLRRPLSERACAAPTRLIERTIAVLLTGEGANPAASALAEHLDFSMAWDFYRLQDGLGEATSTYSQVLKDLLGRREFSDPSALFNQPVSVDGVRRSLGDLTESVLALANETQQGLNALLGRSTDARPIGFDDLMAML